MKPESRKIPTIILTGFLGTGKTTLLNRLIEFYHSKRTVLLINEFGQVGIDGELLVAGNYEKIELNKGSLFCICVRTDFIDEVDKIATQIKPELLIIEATGLADTSEMEKMLALPNLIEKIDLNACICLVDSQNFHKIKDNLRAPVTQVRSADLVLVNKIDLVSEKQVQNTIDAVRQISPNVPVMATKFAEFPMDQLAGIRHPELAASGTPGEGRPDLVISVTLESAGSFSQQSWETFKSSVQQNIMRLKGFARIDEQIYYIDATAENWREKIDEIHAQSINQLVLIGQNLNEDDIRTTFEQCVTK